MHCDELEKDMEDNNTGNVECVSETTRSLSAPAVLQLILWTRWTVGMTQKSGIERPRKTRMTNYIQAAHLG